ncbi:MAG: cupredoxin domain-containing protein [Acidimicrobiia bacterium]
MATQLKRRTAVVLLAVAGVVIGACGSGSDGDKSSAGGTETPATEAPAGDKITVLGKEFSYDPAKLTLKAGQGSTIVLKNTGSIEHDITVDDAGFKLTVPGNNTREKSLKVGKPGTYQFYCAVSGHKDAGMKGELTVT